jgi:hypothetical protein
MNWRPGKPAPNTADSYQVYDELCAPDGRVVAVLECFAMSPTVYYCNAVTPTGKHMRLAPTATTQRVTGPSVLLA